jgi:hypothetical protein
MKNKKELVKYLPKDQLNSTQIDMFQLEHMKTLESINQSLKINSKLKSAESKDIDLNLNLFKLNNFILYNSLFDSILCVKE